MSANSCVLVLRNVNCLRLVGDTFLCFCRNCFAAALPDMVCSGTAVDVVFCNKGEGVVCGGSTLVATSCVLPLKCG